VTYAKHNLSPVKREERNTRIRELAAQGYTTRAIGDRFGICQTRVCDIIRGGDRRPEERKKFHAAAQNSKVL
jgi:hypothetical protein